MFTQIILGGNMMDSSITKPGCVLASDRSYTAEGPVQLQRGGRNSPASLILLHTTVLGRQLVPFLNDKRLLYGEHVDWPGLPASPMCQLSLTSLAVIQALQKNLKHFMNQ